MSTSKYRIDVGRYAKFIEVSKRVRWDIESDDHQVMEAMGKMKVVNPDGTNQVSVLKNYNGVFASNFSFNVNGKYGVICMTKIGGEKAIFKFWYPHEK